MMLRKSIFTLLVLSSTAMSHAAASFDPATVLRQLTDEEKVALLVGVSSNGCNASGDVGRLEKNAMGAAGATHAVPRLGVPSIILADGPAGLRINPTRKGENRTYYCTGFPVGIHLASTFNPQVVRKVGAAMGNEVLEYGVDVLLAPGVNIQRNPLCGRNFEYYSEDPVAAGLTAAAFIEGVQSQGVGTSLKHFAVNSQEVNRLANDAIVSERALHEIYLRNFEIAVRKAGPWTIMTSYNYINGTHATECKWMLEDLLRGQWGFEGAVMTDWGGGYRMASAVAAGNDMIQPGADKYYNEILDALHDGTLSRQDLDRSVLRVLELVARSPKARGYVPGNNPDMASHAQVALEAAQEGIVLLKRNALPLASSGKIALFAVGSYDFIAGGTGSGDVHRPYVVNLQDGLKKAGFSMDEGVDAFYSEYMKEERSRTDVINKSLPWYVPHERALEACPAGVIKASAQTSSAAIVTFSRISGEGKDRIEGMDFELDGREIQLLKTVSEEFHACGKKVVVVLNICGAVQTASWRDMADDILVCWLPGQEGGTAVADVVSGRVNPSGRLPISFPMKYTDDPSSSDFPQIIPDKPFNYSHYRNFRDGRIRRDIKDIDYTEYKEDIFVGYRYYVTRDVEVAYPFGYGQSYTTFAWDGFSVKKSDDGAFVAKIKVTNTGECSGKDVVQLYVKAPSSSLEMPARELKGYAKTPLLAPGESAEMEIDVPEEYIAYYDPQRHGWITPKGKYTFIAARDAVTIVRKCTVCM